MTNRIIRLILLTFEEPNISFCAQRTSIKKKKKTVTKKMAKIKSPINAVCNNNGEMNRTIVSRQAQSIKKRYARKNPKKPRMLTPQPIHVPGFKYHLKQKVLAYYDDLLYFAICEKCESRDHNKPYYFVHFCGWSRFWDRWLPEEKILQCNAQNLRLSERLQEKLKFKSNHANDIINQYGLNDRLPNRDHVYIRNYAVGQKILCQYNSMYYLAKVLAVSRFSNARYNYLVHYIGWNSRWNEWVNADRLWKL